MSIVKFDRPPSWFLDASETGESTKFSWVVAVALTKWGTPTHGHFVLSLVSLASWDQDGSNGRHLWSHGKIGDCEQSTFVRAHNTKPWDQSWLSISGCSNTVYFYLSFVLCILTCPAGSLNCSENHQHCCLLQFSVNLLQAEIKPLSLSLLINLLVFMITTKSIWSLGENDFNLDQLFQPTTHPLQILNNPSP